MFNLAMKPNNCNDYIQSFISGNRKTSIFIRFIVWGVLDLPQVHALFARLKNELKAKGLTYKDVAEHLDLTEASVKRLFSMEDISLRRLDTVCQLLSIDLSDLTNSIDDDTRSIKQLSEAQELEIVSDERMLAMSFLVFNGWTFDEMLKYFDFTEPELVSRLVKLDKLNLMELLPKNRIKLRVASNLIWRKNGPIQKFFVEHFQTPFMQNQFSRENEFLRFLSGMYSPSSCSIILRKLQELAREIDQLNQEDRKLSLKERIPFGVLMATRPWHAEFFDKMRKH